MTHPGRLHTLSFSLVCAIAAVLAPGAAWAQSAQNQNVYTVEVIVFRNMSGGGGPEDWSARPTARGPDKPDSTFTGRFIQAVPNAQFQLNDVAAKLQNTSNYQPIAHFAWQQTASSWGSRAGFSIAKLAGNVPGLTGTIYLESGSYLHLGMALNYQPSNPPTGLGADPGTVFMMGESRRVIPFKPTYYDHPAFGVIALVTRNKAGGGR
jgi:hypothetical protein